MRHIHFHKPSQKYQVQIWDAQQRKLKYFGLWGSLELAEKARDKGLRDLARKQ